MFYTHGNSGKIFFGEQQGNRTIDAGVLQTKLNGYDALFPKFTRMHFAGCNVAEDEVGWKFLETAGKVFLKRGGGLTFGWDSVGLGVGGNLIADVGAAVVGGVVGGVLLHNLLEGKVEHVTGTACYVWIQIGGDPVHRYYDDGLGNHLAHLALQLVP